MNWSAIRTIYCKELRDSIRDRRTLISTIVVPTIIIPLLIFGAGFVMKNIVKKARSEASAVMLVGGADSPRLVAAFQSHDAFRIVPATEDYKAAVSNKQVRVAVEIPAGFDAALDAGEVPVVSILHYEGEMKSSMGRNQVDNFLERYRSEHVQTALRERGLSESLVTPFKIESKNVAPPEKVGGNAIGGFVPYMIIILCFTGAMYPAMDLTAGEKERGTMETLLCSPVNRINIVLGKFLLVLTASAATVALAIAMMGLSVFLAPIVLGGGGGAAAASGAAKGATAMLIDPLGLVGVFAMVIPVAVLFAAVELTVALFAKSFKEAQSYVSPMMILVFLPAMMGMLPGVELSVKTALIPIMNISLVCKEMLSGVWNWSYIGLIFGSSAIYSAIALAVCVRMFNREDVIFRA